MVCDGRDLFEAVCQAIEEIQSELENRGEGVAGFWTIVGLRQSRIAKTSSGQEYVTSCSALELPVSRRGLFGPNRVDFFVEFARPEREALSVAIELKTARKDSGRSWLVDTVEEQLWEKYLQLTGRRHGIHIVLWFRDEIRYDFPRQWTTAEELLAEINSVVKSRTSPPNQLIWLRRRLTARHRNR